MAGYVSSAETIASIDDLLIEIFLRLPIRHLFRLRLVSKRWHSLISTTYNSNLRYHYPYTPSGLFLQQISQSVGPGLEFIPFNSDANLTNDASLGPLTVAPPPVLENLILYHSCNGLLSCATRCQDNDFEYHIYNPTIKKFNTLPKIEGNRVSVDGLYVAFDPSKSFDHKVVCVWSAFEFSHDHHRIEMYLSETGSWRSCGDIFTMESLEINSGVYWNGAINWFNPWPSEDSIYFNVDQACLGRLPTLPINDNSIYEHPYTYFGESRDHLLLVQAYGWRTAQFKVYEMERDYSEWLVKFSVDLDGLTTTFPEIVQSNLDPLILDRYAYVILSIVYEEKDEDSFLVLHLPGKAVRYNFVSNTFKKLPDTMGLIDKYPNYDGWFEAFPYYESLAPV